MMGVVKKSFNELRPAVIHSSLAATHSPLCAIADMNHDQSMHR
jgi:hypothetical protein